MCGIAGEIRFDGRPASVDRVSKMIRQMKNRGPDSSGLVVHNNVALGHRRLKIIDLSEKAQQPMSDQYLGLTLVFNGCIYNHLHLRKQLEKMGYRFFSNSDSEVIIKAYHAWGEDCVKKFNGMFAIAIHERDSGKLFIARDRLGIKPVYFIKKPGVLRFASSLPALIQTMNKKPEIDPVALHYYMTFHSVVPAPRTIFESVVKVPPGTCYIFDKTGMFRENRYWRVEYANDNDRSDVDKSSDEDFICGLLEKLEQAVKRRAIADVPVGVLLSGGVDSSLIVGLLAGLNHSDLQTFSVGFEDTPEETGNEFQYSDIVSERFGTEHHRFIVNSSDIISFLPKCFQAMSEPMVSHDNIGFYLLGERVSKHVKVVQSGQGADEVFGGYHWYQAMKDSRQPLNDYAKAFFDRTHNEYKQAVSDRFIDDDHSRLFVKNNFAEPGATDPVDKALRLDTTVMLVDDPVKRVDNMTMAWGLEARVPFLDHEVVEYAARIPPRLKIKNGGKYVLKEAARRVIPSEVIDRPKGYFPVPVLKYLRGEVLDFVSDTLNNQVARERNTFKQAYIDKLLSDPVSHITPLQGSKLWQLATLELWMQTHGI